MYHVGYLPGQLPEVGQTFIPPRHETFECFFRSPDFLLHLVCCANVSIVRTGNFDLANLIKLSPVDPEGLERVGHIYSEI